MDALANRMLRFDSVGGASGDMILGALADLGADLGAVMTQVRMVLPDHFQVVIEPVTLDGLRGTRVRVHVHDHDPPLDAEGSVHRHASAHAQAHAAGHAAEGHPGTFRNLPEILKLLAGAPQVPRAVELATATFRRLAVAEAAVHGTTVDHVHFHEVGAVDAIVDIYGACLALVQLGVTAVAVGPLPEGQGTLHCAHGVMPIPSPATAELLKGHPVWRVDEPFELVTPTGAALLTTWQALLPAPAEYAALRHGTGFGQRRLRTRPNLLRATLGTPAGTDAATLGTPAEVRLLEANFDDCPGEWLGIALERLLAAGALDVWHTPIQMKKNRPGAMLSVLCDPSRAEMLKTLLFAETTTFGIREQRLQRTVLERRTERVRTPYGDVDVKLGLRAGACSVVHPELEDCRRLAERHGVAVRVVHAAAMAAIAPSSATAHTPQEPRP